MAHRAPLQEVGAIDEGERKIDALLGEEDGEALRLQFADLRQPRDCNGWADYHPPASVGGREIDS